jgi:IS30 family transposase
MRRCLTCLMKQFTNIYTKRTHLLSSTCQDNIRNAERGIQPAKETVWGRRTSILERPNDIKDMSSYGHWQSKSIESSDKKCALNALLERVSRLTHITKLMSKEAIITSNAICKQLSIYPSNFCLSFTYDNGAKHAFSF